VHYGGEHLRKGKMIDKKLGKKAPRNQFQKILGELYIKKAWSRHGRNSKDSLGWGGTLTPGEHRYLKWRNGSGGSWKLSERFGGGSSD